MVQAFPPPFAPDREGFPAVIAQPVFADLRYVAEFTSPAFDLAVRPATVLSAFHRFINPKFPIALTDMRAAGGPAVSDVIVEVAMFGGNATVGVSVKDMTLAFRQIKTENDLDVCIELVCLSQQALEVGLPDADVQKTVVSHSLTLELDCGTQTAGDYIARSVAYNNQLSLLDFNGGVCQPVVNLEVFNGDDDWRATLLAAPHREIKSALFVACTLEHDDSGDRVADRIVNSRKLIKLFLKSLDVEASLVETE